MSRGWGVSAGVPMPNAAAEIPVSDVRVRSVFKGRRESWTMAELHRAAMLLSDAEDDEAAVAEEAERPLLDTVEQSAYPDPEMFCIERDTTEKFRKRLYLAASAMTPAKRRIVLHALRLAGQPLNVVAEASGVTRERVRQVMNEFRAVTLGSPPAKTGPGRKRWRE